MKVLFLYLITTFYSTQSFADCESPINKTLGKIEVKTKIYSPDLETPQKSIIILPPTGGVTFLEKKYALSFCRDGFIAIIAEEWAGQSEESVELEIHNKLLGLGQKAVDAVMVAVKTQFVGIMGTSLGGLHAATAAGRLDRINAAFVITAGAPMGSIIARSRNSKLSEYRKMRLKKFNYSSIEEYESELNKLIIHDPLKQLNGLKNKPLGMSIATKDVTVPSTYQKRLESEWNPQTVFRFENSHIWTIIKTWWFHSDDIKIFFNQAYRQQMNAQEL